jgi:hypothetical protein
MTRDAELARARNRSRHQGPESMETRGRDFDASAAGTVRSRHPAAGRI